MSLDPKAHPAAVAAKAHCESTIAMNQAITMARGAGVCLTDSSESARPLASLINTGGVADKGGAAR